MKRFFTFFAAILLASATITPSAAQQVGQWSVRGGVGWFSLPDFIGILVAGFGTAFNNPEGSERQEFIPLLNPSIEAHYSFNEWFALGGSLACGYASSKSTHIESGALNKKVWAAYPTLCVSAQTTYFRKGKFSMYGLWGLGVTAMFSQQTSEDSSAEHNTSVVVAPMGNLYPLGISFGNNIGGFAEFGWGTKGIVNIGAYCNFSL